MNNIQLGWVAGIIEGEGSFLVGNAKNKTQNPRIEVTTTDQDVTERLKEFTGVGRIYGPYSYNKGNRLVYMWIVSRTDDVVWLSELIMPLLQERRRHRLQAVLEETLIQNRV